MGPKSTTGMLGDPFNKLKERNVQSSFPSVKLVVSAVAALLAIMLFFTTYFTVAQYERGVVTSFGKVSYVAEPGLHFKIPFVNGVTYYRTDIQTLTPEKAANTYTVDNQEVDVVFTVFYRLPTDKVEFVYQNVQDFRERLFSLAIDRLKSEMGKVNVQHIAEKRGELRDRIHSVLATDARELGVEVTDFQLSNIEYTKSFRTAVEAAAAAKAMVETREQEKQQAVRQAEKAKIVAEGEANAAREKARGEADAIALRAKAEAESMRIKGEAQASAMRAQAEALARNPVLVEMKKAEQWNGVLPAAIYAGAPIPFLQTERK